MFDYFNDKKSQKKFLRYFKSREKLGFIFQDFNLLDTLTVKDNIVFPLALAKHNYSYNNVHDKNKPT